MIHKVINYILLTLVVAAFAIVLYNFLSFRSLWLDEAMLALNVVDRNYSQLLTPLDWKQVAPLGYLIFQKFLTDLLGNQDWVFRLISVCSFVLIIPVAYSFFRTIFLEKRLALLAVVLSITSYYTLRYAVEFKQYIVDLLLTFILFSIHYGSNFSIKRKEIILLIFGSVCIWISNASFIILSTLVIVDVYMIYRIKRLHLFTVLKWLAWLLSIFTYYFLFIKGHPSKAYMHNYWLSNGGFLPSQIVSIDFLHSLGAKLLAFPQLMGANSLILLWSFFSLIGIYRLLKSNLPLLLLAVLPVFIHLGMAYFRLYPFTERLILYLLPSFIILIVAGIKHIQNLIAPALLKVFWIPILLAIVLMSSEMIRRSPFEKEEIKTALEKIDAQFQEGDAIYVYYAALPAYAFYKKSYPNLRSAQVIKGNNHREAWLEYAKEFDQIAAKRVWFVVSHPYWVKQEGLLEHEYQGTLLSAKGYKNTYTLSYPGGYLGLFVKDVVQ